MSASPFVCPHGGSCALSDSVIGVLQNDVGFAFCVPLGCFKMTSAVCSRSCILVLVLYVYRRLWFPDPRSTFVVSLFFVFLVSPWWVLCNHPDLCSISRLCICDIIILFISLVGRSKTILFFFLKLFSLRAFRRGLLEARRLRGLVAFCSREAP